LLLVVVAAKLEITTVVEVVEVLEGFVHPLERLALILQLNHSYL
jgi:hypothetical protein